MIALAAEVMRSVGLKDGQYVVRVNDRRILDGVLETIGAAEPERRMRVLRAADKLDRLGRDGVALLLGEGRKDESGDFTEGAKLDSKGIDTVLAFLDATGGSRTDVIARLEPLVGGSSTGEAGLKALGEIHDVLNAIGIGEERALFDPSVVRGLGYYTGPVFEAELLAQATYEDGSPIQFGSVGGGGRYDDLVARFTGQAVPATGFSFGVSRFAAALSALGLTGEADEKPLVVVVAGEKDRSADYLSMAAELRAAGFRAEAFVGSGNMGKQMKYADRRGAVAAVIVGSDEREQGLVTVKDLKLGARLAADITDNKQWREEQPAQETVARQDWIAAVQRISSRNTAS